MRTFGNRQGTTGAFGSGVVATPDYVDARVLAAGVAEAHTVPALAKWVLFSSDNNFYARGTGTAAVPGADVTDGTGSVLNPVAWELNGIATISLISPYATVVTMAFYQ